MVTQTLKNKTTSNKPNRYSLKKTGMIRDRNIKIISIPFNLEYTFKHYQIITYAMDRLNPETIKDILGDSIFSKNIIIHEKIESTNNLAKELAKRGEIEGTVILAEEQTAGRGRMDRKWLSPPFENLLFSIILRPFLPVKNVFVLTMIMSVAVIDEIRASVGLNPMIKWPNDIYMDNRKLGGILTEFSVKAERPEYVIMGLGLNVNWRPEKGEDILFPSTSIRKETGKRTDRNRLLTGFLKRFEGYYNEIISGRMDSLHKRWNDLSLVTGKEVVVESQDGKIKGTALGIDRRGALILRISNGYEQRILSGDVSLTF
jgi:BirA family biotin operon repressor/biotin-[acetyl-CoA-carboxylase] ligase